MNKEAAAKAGALGRRSERVLLKIPIKVKGTSMEGKQFGEDSYTLVINRHGARITLQTPIEPNARITITNKYNNLTAPFRVVVRTGKSLGEGPEWGVECLEPDTQFWGIHFPQKMEMGGEEGPIDALLECSKCSSRELAPLGPAQYHILTARSSLSRECRQCKTTTEWRFSFVEEAWEPTPPPAALPTGAAAPDLVGDSSEPSVSPAAVSPGGACPDAMGGPAPSIATPAKTKDHRRVKRLTLKLPVRVRSDDGRQDTTRTENFSKLGACVISSLEMKEDDRVLVNIGYTGGSSDLEMPARVVWCRPMEGTKMTAYGMEFLKSG